VKNICFLITGISNLQDLLPMIVEASKSDNALVAILDNLSKKNQFKNYNIENIKSLIEDSIIKNEGKKYQIQYFGINDSAVFKKWFSESKCDAVFTQNLTHKGQAWEPCIGKTKIVLFSWHMDGVHDVVSNKSKNLVLNVLRRKSESVFFQDSVPKKLSIWVSEHDNHKKIMQKTKTIFLGNVRLSGLRHNYSKNTASLIEKLKNKKVCFIAESHIRMGDNSFIEKSLPSLGQFVDNLISLLKEKGFYVVWKKREKGLPKKSYSPLEFCKNKPDLIIEKDLNYPASLFCIPSVSKKNIVLNTSNCVFDIADINSDTALIITPNPTKREIERCDSWFDKKSFKVIKSKNQNDILDLDEFINSEITEDSKVCEKPADILAKIKIHVF
tara:strand:- start:1099 stop:2253 length:1155 start_codon:yes stop_codon:yes gene_type:complete